MTPGNRLDYQAAVLIPAGLKLADEREIVLVLTPCVCMGVFLFGKGDDEPIDQTRESQQSI